METTVMFAKVKKDAIIPSKIQENAGFDVYAYMDETCIIIPPHTTKMIPTGIASACSDEYCFILKERGSTGTKGIGQRCGVIDSGYRGEWFVPVTNHNNKPLCIFKDGILSDEEYDEMTAAGYTMYPYTKAITQALVIPVPRVNVKEVSFDELNKISSERGTGALGSSGK